MGAHNDLGAAGETIAATYLSAAGYTVRDRNWRGDHGELDIVATRGAVVVIVEVKTRSTMAFGDPLAAVDARKLERLWRLAWQWVRAHPDIAAGRDVRVDVIGITGAGDLVHLEDVR